MSGVNQKLLKKAVDHSVLSEQVSVLSSLKFSMPFVLSRLASAIQGFSNGLVTRQLSVPGLVSASPIMFNLQQGFMGLSRGVLSASMIVAGNNNGAKDFSKVGPAANQGLQLSLFMGIPTAVLFYCSESILQGFGVPTLLAKQAGEFLRALSYGIVPANFAFSDQLILLGLKRKQAPILLNTLRKILACAIGFPWAIISESVAPLGWGVGIASVISFLAGRVYLYLNEEDGVRDQDRYHFFTTSFDSGTAFKELLLLAFPLALQTLSEWLPGILITILTATLSNAKSQLEAEEPASQFLIFVNQLLFGMGAAATAYVANMHGAGAFQSVQKIGYKVVLASVALVAFPALFAVVFPGLLFSLFSKHKAVQKEGVSILRWAAGSVVFDASRLAITGAIFGKKVLKGNLISAGSNLLITGVLATAVGYGLSKHLNSAVYFYVSRGVGVAITQAVLLCYWKKSETLPKTALPTRELGGAVADRERGGGDIFGVKV